MRALAGVAQLVEHQLPKLRVVGSSPIARFRIHAVLRRLRRPPRSVPCPAHAPNVARRRHRASPAPSPPRPAPGGRALLDLGPSSARSSGLGRGTGSGRELRPLLRSTRCAKVLLLHGWCSGIAGSERLMSLSPRSQGSGTPFTTRIGVATSAAEHGARGDAPRPTVAGPADAANRSPGRAQSPDRFEPRAGSSSSVRSDKGGYLTGGSHRLRRRGPRRDPLDRPEASVTSSRFRYGGRSASRPRTRAGAATRPP